MNRSAALCPVLLLFTACGDDVAGVPEPSAACTITERALLAAPPEGWSVQQYGDYDLYVVDDMILYSFDERDDPARQFHRLDRCSGESTPFPSFRPGMQAPFIHETAAGRVLYAKKDNDYYVVDRLDDAGDDEPRKIAGLPQPGLLDFTGLWAVQTRPYAFFQREDGLYTHAGDPSAAALQVAGNVAQAEPYEDAILVVEKTGDVRIVDPYTGSGDVVLTGSQRTWPLDHGSTILEPGRAIEDARVLWQPLGVNEFRIRRIGGGQEIVLAIDPSLLAISDVGRWFESDDLFMIYDREARQLLAVVDGATGATIDVPAHVDYDVSLPGPRVGLTLAGGDTVVEAIWDPKTGALREWYRGVAPAPSLHAAEATHVDYYVRDQVDPPRGSLWRLEFATGERRVLVPRMSPWSSPVTEDTRLVEFDVGPQSGVGPLLHLRDLEYVEVDAGRTTPIAEAVAAARAIPGEGVIWLDMHGGAPGLWVAPPP